MAKLVYGLNVSLDGYVDHQKIGPPGPVVFRHHIEQVRGLSGLVYGRTMYEIMQYWDDERSEWGAVEREFAAVWRAQRKWVVSRTLKSVGSNATLISEDAEAAVRRLKAELDGEMDVGGTVLAQSLTEAGLIDAYRLHLRPIVMGSGTPFFAGPVPKLRLVGSDEIGEGVVQVTYEPAGVSG